MRSVLAIHPQCRYCSISSHSLCSSRPRRLRRSWVRGSSSICGRHTTPLGPRNLRARMNLLLAACDGPWSTSVNHALSHRSRASAVIYGATYGWCMHIYIHGLLRPIFGIRFAGHRLPVCHRLEDQSVLVSGVLPVRTIWMGNYSRHEQNRSWGVGSLRRNRLVKEDTKRKVDRI